MSNSPLLLLAVYSGLIGAAPLDCIMTPVKQQVNDTKYLVTGVITTNLDATTTEGAGYRYYLRNLTHLDSLKHCVTGRLKITTVLKGKLLPGHTIEVVSPQSEAPVFKIGGRYVLFLRREGPRFFVYSCSYSSELNADPASVKLMHDISTALK